MRQYAIIGVNGQRVDGSPMRGTIEFEYVGELDQMLQVGAEARMRGGNDDGNFTVTSIDLLTGDEYVALMIERGEREGET